MVAGLAFGSFALAVIKWAVLGAFLIWVYRHVRWPSLRWIGAYLVVSVVLGMIAPMFIRSVVDRGEFPFGWPQGTFILATQYAMTMFRAIGTIIVAVMLMAEFAPLVVRASAAKEDSPVPLSSIRANHVPLGVLLLASTIGPFLFVVALWLA